jgi:hypothetical protein
MLPIVSAEKNRLIKWGENHMPQGKEGQPHQHHWEAVDFDNMADDRIKCAVCGLTKVCEHNAGEFIENPSGCCFCRLCGRFRGLAH